MSNSNSNSTQTTEGIQVYVADLTDYNEGRLIGQWFNLSHYRNSTDLQAAIDEMLAGRTAATGELHEEWAIHDVSDSSGVVAFDGDLDLDELFEIQQAIAEHGADIVGAALAEDIPLDEINDRYMGTFDAPAQWAESYIYDTGALDALPENLRGYFDYEAFAEDARLSGEMVFSETTNDFVVFHMA